MAEAGDRWSFVSPDAGRLDNIDADARAAQAAAQAGVGQALPAPERSDDLAAERDDEQLADGVHERGTSWPSMDDAAPDAARNRTDTGAPRGPRIMRFPDGQGEPAEQQAYRGAGAESQQDTAPSARSHVRIFSLDAVDPGRADARADRYPVADDSREHGPWQGAHDAPHDGTDAEVRDGDEPDDYGVPTGRVDLGDHRQEAAGYEDERADDENEQEDAGAERDRAKEIRQQLGRVARGTGRKIAEVAGKGAEALRDGPGTQIAARYYASGVLHDHVAEAKRMAPFGRKRSAARNVYFQGNRIKDEARREYLEGAEVVRQIRKSAREAQEEDDETE